MLPSRLLLLAPLWLEAHVNLMSSHCSAASAAAHQSTLSEAKLQAAFDFIDADKDGRVSKGADLQPSQLAASGYALLSTHCSRVCQDLRTGV